LSELDKVVLDLETTGLVPFKDKILLFIVGNKDKQFVIPVSEDTDEFIFSLLLTIKDKKILGHNLKFDCKFILFRYNILLTNLTDTFIQSRILFNGMDYSHSLEECAKRMYRKYLHKIYKNHLDEIVDLFKLREFIKRPEGLNRVHKKFKELCVANLQLTFAEVIELTLESLFNKEIRKDFTTGVSLSEKHFEYAANDIVHIEMLDDYHKIFIKNYDLEYLEEIEMKFIPVLVLSELKGINFDEEKWIKNTKSNQERLIDVDLKVRQAMEELVKTRDYMEEEFTLISHINLASPVQLVKFFNQFDNKITSTGNDFLFKYLRDENPPEALARVIKLLIGEYDGDRNCYRSIAKLCSTYGTKFLTHVNEGIIRTEFKQVSTTTGRLASGDLKEEYTTKNGTTASRKTNTYVPLQNLPVDESLRSCFIAKQGYGLIKIDMSAAEVRVAAHQSKCDFLIKAMNEGMDMHSKAAEVTFRIVKNDPKLEVSKTENKNLRNQQKGITFSLFYGAGVGKISELLNVQQGVARKVYAALKGLMPELFEYLDKVSSFAVKHGYVIANSVTKRRRWFGEYIKYRDDPNTFGIPYENVHSIKREASNFPIQGTNADMLKLAAINIENYLREKYGNNYDIRQLFWVHDEFVIQVPEENMEIDRIEIEGIIIESCNKFLGRVSMEVEGVSAYHWVK
jgi:DNA polymerase I-like protein with 3'-5' exonuclease and polymerase domains